MGGDRLSQQLPHERVAEMVAVFSNQVVTVAAETTVVPQLVQGLVQLLRSAVEGPHVDLAPEPGIGGLPRRAVVDSALVTIAVLSTGYFHAGMVQPHSNGVEVIVGRAQIVDVQQHLRGLRFFFPMIWRTTTQAPKNGLESDRISEGRMKKLLTT